MEKEEKQEEEKSAPKDEVEEEEEKERRREERRDADAIKRRRGWNARSSTSLASRPFAAVVLRVNSTAAVARHACKRTRAGDFASRAKSRGPLPVVARVSIGPTRNLTASRRDRSRLLWQRVPRAL